MKTLCLSVGLCMFLSSNAQILKTTQVVTSIVRERAIYLNGGARASIGGKSRVTIPVELPPNTKSWYYSFSTTPGESGVSNLNLAIQLSALAMGPVTKAVLDKINVPSGSASIDVFVLTDQNNSDLFLRKVDLDGTGTFYVYPEGTASNTRSGVVQITEVTQGTVYLGLKNPSALEGININIEVVALAEQVEQISDQESEAITMGSLGWKAFERGDIDRCLELSRKAIDMDGTLGFVQFNIALCLLMKGQSTDALEAYTKAIAVTRKSSVAKQTFDGAINDLRNNMAKFPSQSDAQDILSTLLDEVKRY